MPIIMLIRSQGVPGKVRYEGAKQEYFILYFEGFIRLSIFFGNSQILGRKEEAIRGHYRNICDISSVRITVRIIRVGGIRDQCLQHWLW